MMIFSLNCPIFSQTSRTYTLYGIGFPHFSQTFIYSYVRTVLKYNQFISTIEIGEVRPSCAESYSMDF